MADTPPAASRAAALRDLAYQAYRKGDAARARQLFERALALLPPSGADTAVVHSDIGVAASALGDLRAAQAHHEAALALRRAAGDPAELAASLHNLAVVQRQLGALADAEAGHRESVALWRGSLGADHPAVARGLASLGVVARQLGDGGGALACHQEALRIRQLAGPAAVADVAASFDDLAADHMQLGDYAMAVAAWRECLALRPRAAGAAVLTNMGIAYRRWGDLPAAERCFAAALAADPANLAARHNLAALLARLGRAAEAAVHRDQALARESVFVQPCGRAGAPRVLILSTAELGNVPLEFLLPEDAATRIWWFAGHGAGVAAALPAFDVVLNGIGDPDLAGPSAACVAAFVAGCDRAILNDPARVEGTRRDRLPATLALVRDCVVPTVVRFAAPASVPDLQRFCQGEDVAPPFLLRPAGAHGGAGVRRVDDWAGFDPAMLGAAPVWYATHFVDCRLTDGYVRKYRIIYVGGVAYPYHLAISADWLVHYFSADMVAHAWKLAEEAAFLADWQAAVGARAAAAIRAIGAALRLDYCGVDFAVMPDGRALIFEANATMLVHPEAPDGPLSFKNESVTRIVSAAQALLAPPRARPLKRQANE